MQTSRSCLFILSGVCALIGSAPTQAAPRIRLHHSEFYARAPEALEIEARSTAAGPAFGSACYVSLSATEATRGIRHWTGGC